MSCEFILTATLEGLNKFLENEKSNESGNEKDTTKNALSDCKIGVSPTGEIIAFAKKTWMLICGSKWDSSTDGPKVKYSPKCYGHVSCKQEEEITSVLCLPFLSQGQSIQSGADWTCIVVGFSSGCIRFYTEEMQELACSILQEEPITYIKCQYFTSPQQSKTLKQESPDLCVLYKSVICILNGSVLSQSLRNRRYQLARGATFTNSDTEQYMTVDFKKYSFVSQEEVTDACFLNHTLEASLNTFDHLVTASLIDGFNSNYRASPPQTSLIVTSGRRPFVGFHYTYEGSSSPVLTDVALAVASKIKNSVTSTLPDWFGFGSKKPTPSDKPKEVAQEYAEKLNCRFGLCDLWRQGLSVIASPDGTLSAVSDSLGRVFLIDNATGIAHRLWKGFRDAQCGFLQVKEDIQKTRRSKGSGPKPQPRQGLFIVIYAPKKGLVEIFTTQNGRKVTSFKVTKHGRLLYTPRFVGTQVQGGFTLSQNQVLFISEEGVKEFLVPFHCALAEDNSKMSRDLHVLKKMKMLLKMENHSGNSKFVEDIEKCAKELKTDVVRLQAIESMATYRNTTLEAFKAVLKVFLNDLQSTDSPDPSVKKIVAFAEAIYNLLSFYEFLLNLNDSSPSAKVSESDDSFSESLRLPQTELDLVLKLISQITEIEGKKKQITKVAFEEKKSTKLGQYLSCFDFESFLNNLDRNEKQEDKKEIKICRLNLKSSSKEKKYCYLGEIFFKGVFSSASALAQWKLHAESCLLNPSDLALCLLSYWCSKPLPSDLSSEVPLLVEILKVVCSLNEPNVVAVECNTESPWWLQLRMFIASSPNTIQGLFAALCCRSVTIFVEQEKELSLKHSEKKLKSSEEPNVSSAFSSDWETISKDTCQWDILITQLQDVALLNVVLNLSFKEQSESKIFPEVPFDFENQCLTSIQTNGIGRVSELVAKWMVQFGFDPTVLINKSDLEFQPSAYDELNKKGKDELVDEFNKANEARVCDPNLNLALEYLALLKSRFPYSLTCSSLLGNMSWEYIAYWYKNLSDLEYLQAALRYLEIVPANRIKYGICYLSLTTYLGQKFETLARIIHRAGKALGNVLCSQEFGLRNDQVATFLRLISEYLKILLLTDVDDVQDFGVNQEAIWQNSSTATATSLVSIALSQPVVNCDVIMFQLQLSYSLLVMCALNIKQTKIFTTLFENVDQSSFSFTKTSPPSSHHQNLKLKASRTEFLQKVLTAAVQTVEVVEDIPTLGSGDSSEALPSTRLKVDEYKVWLQICFDLAGMWAISEDDLKRHQICELYDSGYDRLAEEVIPSVNETTLLASQLLVLGGKRLKYLIQDSPDLNKKMANLIPKLSDWIQTLDLESFKFNCNSIDDIEVMMCYVVKWLPEGHPDQKMAISIIESLSFLKTKNS